jgi:hypothetical protein
MPELANLEQGIKKIPPWGWVAIAGGIGVVLYLQNKSSGSAPAAAGSTAADTGTGSSNTTTPTGTLCPDYAVPVCLPPGVVIYEADENGCPKPVCSSSLTGSTGGSTSSSSPISLCHSAPHGGHCVYGQNCPGATFRQIFSAVGQDPNCALQWNPTGAYLGLDRDLWPGFVVYY